jgi:PhnB protein
MSAILNPYLSFQGTAAEALTFYRDVFGGDLQIMRFGDMPDMPGNDPSLHEQVMHGQVNGENGVTLMASDLPPSMGEARNGTVSLSGDDDELLRSWWTKLSDGGEVAMPLAQAPWGDHYGQLTDRFGISWLVDISPGADR